MSQFTETNTTTGKCSNPGCGKDIPTRNIHDVRKNKANYCSRVCASQSRYATRYKGSLSGPMDKPVPMSKTKLN